MAKSYQIPFDAKGNMLAYDAGWETNIKKDVYTFSEEMSITGYSRGRSSAQFILIDSKGKTYRMFLSDTFDMLSRADISKGKVSGSWTFVKKGANYGLQFV